jgi:hypothetical protein
LGILSSDGKSKTFDKSGDGFAPGEGVGLLLLQRLNDAIENGNNIYGIIKGCAENHNANSYSMTAPDVKAQTDVISAALRNADLTPDTVTYIETHGTGTSLGDPIEVEALINVFGEYTDKKQFCRIGAVKTNVGHLESAAGVAGIIKVLMMMRHEQIPPSLNFNTPNPVINFEESPLIVAAELSEWKRKDDKTPLRAGVSAFGFGGANAHIILEEPPILPALKTNISEPSLFLLSAKSKESLKSSIDKWRTFIESEKCNSYNLDDICKTLASGRESFSYRCGTIVNTKEDIERFIKQSDIELITSDSKRLCLIVGDFSLKGFPDIEEFFAHHPVLKENLDKTISFLPSDIKEIFIRKTWDLENHELCSFIAGYAYYSAFKDIGIKPDLITGYGNGVWLSLVISGMLTFDDAVLVLNGQKEAGQIKLSYPKIVYYYHPKDKNIVPYHFNGTYTRALLENLESEKEPFDYYISKARLLLESQFTFKKFIEEWSAVLKEKDIYSMLAEEATQSLSVKEKNLISVIVLWALFKLNRKWGLKEERKFKDTRFYEIADLLIDEVLPKDRTLELFLSENPDIDAIAKTLNIRSEKINYSHPYSLLIKHQTLNFIKDTAEWIENAIQSEAPIPKQEDLILLELGKCELDMDESIKIPDLDDKTFETALLGLWLSGMSIDFTRLYLDVSFRKVALPVYRFQGKRFWLPKIAGSEVAEAVSC